MAKKENNKHTIINIRRYFLLFCRISLYQNQLQQPHVFPPAQNRSIGVMRPAREFTLYTTKSGIWPPILQSTLVGNLACLQACQQIWQLRICTGGQKDISTKSILSWSSKAAQTRIGKVSASALEQRWRKHEFTISQAEIVQMQFLLSTRNCKWQLIWKDIVAWWILLMKRLILL